MLIIIKFQFSLSIIYIYSFFGLLLFCWILLCCYEYLHRYFNVSPSSMSRIDVWNRDCRPVHPLVGVATIKIWPGPFDWTRWIAWGRGSMPNKGFIGTIIVRNLYCVCGFWVMSASLIWQPCSVPLIDSILFIGIVLWHWIVGNGTNIGGFDGV